MAQLIKRTAGAEANPTLLRRLKALSFLGIEVRENEFEFLETDPGDKRADVLARKVAELRGQSPRYSIHPAYRSYLEIQE